MRRTDRKLDDPQTLEILERGEYGMLCLIDLDGLPYGVPLNYALMDGKIYLHAATEGKKLQCIEKNSHICFTVVGQTEVLPDKFSTRYESVMVFGQANLVGPSTEKDEALLALIRKYSTAHIEAGIAYINNAKDKTAVIRIVPKEMTGKKRV